MKEVEVPNVPNGSNGVPIGGALVSWWGTLVLKGGTLLMMTEGRSINKLVTSVVLWICGCHGDGVRTGNDDPCMVLKVVSVVLSASLVGARYPVYRPTRLEGTTYFPAILERRRVSLSLDPASNSGNF